MAEGGLCGPADMVGRVVMLCWCACWVDFEVVLRVGEGEVERWMRCGVDFLLSAQVSMDICRLSCASANAFH